MSFTEYNKIFESDLEDTTILDQKSKENWKKDEIHIWNESNSEYVGRSRYIAVSEFRAKRKQPNQNHCWLSQF